LEHPFIIVDEICDSKDYFVGGWSAANYWGLTDQVPMQVDVFTTRRQGKINVLNTRIVFHRTSKKNVKNCIKENIESHSFFIQLKEDSKEWLKSRK
jgi:predicted transcriptional regulator of viral defense system